MTPDQREELATKQFRLRAARRNRDREHEALIRRTQGYNAWAERVRLLEDDLIDYITHTREDSNA